MDSKSDIQLKLANFIANLRYEALPPENIHDAKYRVLDWVGSALAGTEYKASSIIKDLIREMGGANQATLIKGGVKVPLAQAALANAVIGHVAEYDDGHRLAIGHPGAVVLPAALATAEGLNASGKELLTAVIAGYEVFIRLGTAINPSHYKTWHTTGTCGVFGAAAAAARLLGLDQRQTLMALGISGTMAAGLLETLGTHAKPLNAGHASQSGIQAALLAKAGFTGPEDILFGNKGFVRSTADKYDIEVLADIDKGRLVADSAFYKIYASCGHTNSPLDATFILMDENNIPVETIKRIDVETYRTSVELTGRLRNQDEEEAKFSLPYCIAAALKYKKVTLAEFTQEKLTSPDLVDLACKVRVVEDPEATRAFPARQATVSIELSDGRVLKKRVENSNDEPNYPAIEAKFISLAAPCIGEERAHQLKAMLLDLENADSIGKLVQYLA